MTQQMVKKQITLAVPDIGNEELEEINKVFKTGFLTEGSTTKEFESVVADYLGFVHLLHVWLFVVELVHLLLVWLLLV